MNSSTSSSNPFRTELRVIAVVLALFATAELTLRVWGSAISHTLRKVEALPVQADHLDQAKPPRLLLLGNSLSLCGINMPQLTMLADQQLDPSATIEAVQFNGSHLTEWYWVYRLYYLNAHIEPDYVVLNVVPSILVDRSDIRRRRMAACFGWTRWPIVPSNDIPQFEHRAEFLLARSSRLYNRAERIGHRIKTRCLPHAQETLRWINSKLKTQQRSTRKDLWYHPDRQSLELLERFLTMIETTSTTPVFLFMPTHEPYEIPTAMVTMIERVDGLVIDARYADSLIPNQFDDGVHMTPEGAERFTPEYFQLLSHHLSELHPRQ